MAQMRRKTTRPTMELSFWSKRLVRILLACAIIALSFLGMRFGCDGKSNNTSNDGGDGYQVRSFAGIKANEYSDYLRENEKTLSSQEKESILEKEKICSRISLLVNAMPWNHRYWNKIPQEAIQENNALKQLRENLIAHFSDIDSEFRSLVENPDRNSYNQYIKKLRSNSFLIQAAKRMVDDVRNEIGDKNHNIIIGNLDGLDDMISRSLEID